MKKGIILLIVCALMLPGISHGSGISKKNREKIRQKEIEVLVKSKQVKLDQIKLYQEWIKKHELEIVQIQTLLGYLNGTLKILPDEPEPKKKTKKKKKK